MHHYPEQGGRSIHSIYHLNLCRRPSCIHPNHHHSQAEVSVTIRLSSWSLGNKGRIVDPQAPVSHIHTHPPTITVKQKYPLPLGYRLGLLEPRDVPLTLKLLMTCFPPDVPMDYPGK